MNDAKNRRNGDAIAAELLSALSDDGGLQSIIDIGHKMFQNPIVVTDKSWKALGMTPGIDMPDDTDWNELASNGMLSPDSVASGIRENLAERIEGSTGPFVWRSADMKYPRLFSKIMAGGKNIATISVVEFTKPFDDGDLSALKLLCDAVAAELQKDQFLQYTRGLMYEDFFWNLLDGRLTDSKAIAERVKVLNLGIKRNIYVFVFDLEEYDQHQFSLTYMRDILEKMISGGHALIYSDKIVITASFTRARDIFKTELEKLGVFLERYGIRCGISRRCIEPAQLRFHYEQALDALRVGKHMDADRFIYPYGEYAIYHIAELCGQRGGAQKFGHPALAVLLAYDSEYGASFTHSLYAYIRHFKNITKTANALYVHRNTLVYHLRRIEEITEVNLSDYNVMQLFELSFRLLEYDKRIERWKQWDVVPEEEN